MFTGLTIRSDFSLGESTFKIDDIVKELESTKQTAAAITDTMSVTSLVDFAKKAKDKNIKSIIGCNLRIVDDIAARKIKGEKFKQNEYYITWYVLTEKGLKALYKLLSVANDSDHFYFTAKLSIQDVYDALKTVTSEDVCIAFSDAYSVGLSEDAVTIAKNISALLSASKTLINLVPINTPFWDAYNKRHIEIAKEAGLGFLVTRPVFYKRGFADSAEIMSAIYRNNKVTDPWHYSNHVRSFHILNNEEFHSEVINTVKRLHGKFGLNAAHEFANGISNQKNLVDFVKYEWKKQEISLPKMSSDEFETLKEEAIKGFKDRFSKEIFGHKPSKEELKEVYLPRLQYELSILKKLGFAGYFLLVQDVVRFAKSNGILVGPGRGSVGGSLVAYVCGITDCDPIRFGLLFERFINPDRIDLPDADLDFMSERRDEIIEYLNKKYGKEKVAAVSNYISLGSASSLRDTGKAIGLSEVDYACSKLIPAIHGQPIPLEDAVKEVAEISEYAEKNPVAWENALSLQDVNKTLGTHAAGIIVSECDITDRGVVETRSGLNVVNWDKRIVEEQGLVKMDILGLKTLDLIADVCSRIKKTTGKNIDLSSIPLDDKKVLSNFAEGRTIGVFQFESSGMRRLLKELGKDGNITFDDVTAATALYRPGPMESGMMDSYFLRKQGLEDIEYDHPLMEEILEPTFGVMVYQEQVMQVSRTIAGYSAPDADKLRKIMGKKLPEEMKKERGKFVKGCVETISCTEEWAGDLFDKIEGFAGYGFNKSHSVEYTLISLQCMWLKTYYPQQFVASALSMFPEKKLPELVKESKRLGLNIRIPDINKSEEDFKIIGTDLYIPFTAIKGISTNAAKEIVRARGSEPFKSIDDLSDRVTRRICNKGHIEKLNLVGAFASIESGQKSADDESRIKDQVMLIPGLITNIVPIDREMHSDKETIKAIACLITKCKKDNIEDGIIVKPCMGKRASFMTIFDAPTNSEEVNGVLTYGNNFGTIKMALADNGLERSDGYWTSLIKRPKEGKQVSVDEIKRYSEYLNKEIEILRPSVIVLMGTQTVRHFIPGFKGKASDEAGKVIYNEALDCNMIIGFNPGEVFFDPEKQDLVNDIYYQVESMLKPKE